MRPALRQLMYLVEWYFVVANVLRPRPDGLCRKNIINHEIPSNSYINYYINSLNVTLTPKPKTTIIYGELKNTNTTHKCTNTAKYTQSFISFILGLGFPLVQQRAKTYYSPVLLSPQLFKLPP